MLQGAGKLAGIAFQSLIGAENTGYVIPVPVVNHFLTDLERHGGRYTGGWRRGGICGDCSVFTLAAATNLHWVEGIENWLGRADSRHTGRSHA